jgi:GGDEF domain-containing protein
MKFSGTRDKMNSNITYATSANENYLYVINKWSRIAFYDCNLNITSPSISNNYYYDVYDFTVSSEFLLKNNSYHTHTLLVFDIKSLNATEAESHYMNDSRFSNYVDTIINSNIQKPDLYCRLNDETIVVLLENYSSIDVAMLVINLNEDIVNYKPEYNINLKFGTCIAQDYEFDIISLYRRAYFAKSTMKDNDQQLMANYNEIILQKKVL